MSGSDLQMHLYILLYVLINRPHGFVNQIIRIMRILMLQLRQSIFV